MYMQAKFLIADRVSKQRAVSGQKLWIMGHRVQLTGVSRSKGQLSDILNMFVTFRLERLVWSSISSVHLQYSWTLEAALWFCSLLGLPSLPSLDSRSFRGQSFLGSRLRALMNQLLTYNMLARLVTKMTQVIQVRQNTTYLAHL